MFPDKSEELGKTFAGNVCINSNLSDELLISELQCKKKKEKKVVFYK